MDVTHRRCAELNVWRRTADVAHYKATRQLSRLHLQKKEKEKKRPNKRLLDVENNYFACPQTVGEFLVTLPWQQKASLIDIIQPLLLNISVAHEWKSEFKKHQRYKWVWKRAQTGQERSVISRQIRRRRSPDRVVQVSGGGLRLRGRRCTWATRKRRRINSRGRHRLSGAFHQTGRLPCPEGGRWKYICFLKNHCSISPAPTCSHLNQSVARLHAMQSLPLVPLQVTSSFQCATQSAFRCFSNVLVQESIVLLGLLHISNPTTDYCLKQFLSLPTLIMSHLFTITLKR